MIYCFDEQPKITHEMPLRLGLVALLTLDPSHPRKLAPDQHFDVKTGHFVSQSQNGPNNDKGAIK